MQKAGVAAGREPQRQKGATVQRTLQAHPKERAATQKTGRAVSRPSRGTSRSTDVATIGPVCPPSASLTITVMSDNDWEAHLTWAPGIAFDDIEVTVSVNGGAPVVLNSFATSPPPIDFGFDPTAIGNSGDTLSFAASCTGGGACPDVVSNTVDMVIP